MSQPPVVLVIPGAFPTPSYLANLSIDGAEVTRIFLPGFQSQRTASLSIEAFAEVIDQHIADKFAERSIVALGLSAGALATLALRRPEISSRVLVEPFLSTAKLESLRQWTLSILAQHPKHRLLHEWVEAIFGYTLTGTADRNYRHLLSEHRGPLHVLAGDPSIQIEGGLPSLTDHLDRELLREAGATLTTGQFGHEVPESAIKAAILTAIEIDQH